LHKNFRYFSPQELHGILKEMSCEYKKIRIDSKRQIRIVAIEKGKIEQYLPADPFEVDFSEYVEEEHF
jgi:hypothetical protein